MPPSTVVPAAKFWKLEAAIVKVFVDWSAAIVTVWVRSAVSRKSFETACVSVTETSRASVVGPVRVSVKVMSSSLNTALVLSAEMLTVGVAAALVVPVPDGDHSPSPSALVARTCTRYAVPASRPVMPTFPPVAYGSSSWGPSVQIDSVVFW